MKKVLIGLFLGLFCCGAYSQTEVINKDVQIGGLITEGYGKKLQFGSPKGNSDDVYFIRNNIESDRTDLILSLGDDDKDKFVIGRKFWNEAEFTQQFVFQTNGNMGIGIANPKNKLDVNGTIRAKEVKVESEWADFVFKKDYNLPTLEEVEQHIEEKGTLPGVPSEKEVKANGVNLAETDVLLLQKIEELTLYIIELKQEIEDLKSQVNN